MDFLLNILLSLMSFIGIMIIYFLKMSFQKLELLETKIVFLTIEIEKLKK